MVDIRGLSKAEALDGLSVEELIYVFAVRHEGKLVIDAVTEDDTGRVLQVTAHSADGKRSRRQMIAHNSTPTGYEVDVFRRCLAAAIKDVAFLKEDVMAEYIEREAALYRAKSFIANHIDGIVAEHAQLPYETCNATEFARGYERGAIDAVKVVLSTPAADVEVVKHGQWIPLEYDGYADGFPVWNLWECSQCQEEHSGDEDTLTPYCPNCGAKMDLEVTNGLDQH